MTKQRTPKPAHPRSLRRKALAVAAVTSAALAMSTGVASADGPFHMQLQDQNCGNQFSSPCALQFPGSDNTRLQTNTYNISNGNQDVFITQVNAPSCTTSTNNVQDGQDGDDNCGLQQNYWWPFSLHSLDTADGSGHVYYIALNGSGGPWARADCISNNNVYQANSATAGREFVRMAYSGSYHQFANVQCADQKNSPGGTDNFFFAQDEVTGFVIACDGCPGDTTAWEEN